MAGVTRRQFLKNGGVLAAAALLGGYSVCVERYLVETNRYRIRVPHLPQAFSGFRIVQLTDLHYGPLVPLAVIRYAVDQANRLVHDAIVCTGDYVHERESTRQIDTVWPCLSQLRSQHWLRETKQDLRHQAKLIEKDGQRLWLAGAGDFITDHRSLDTLLGDVPEADCRIVLAHSPDTADTAFSSRVDLVISGHTHGGQVCVPFLGPPVLPVRNKTYSSGLKKSPRGTSVFISRGIGWAIYPVRFNCPPEIAVLELVPA